MDERGPEDAAWAAQAEKDRAWRQRHWETSVDAYGRLYDGGGSDEPLQGACWFHPLHRAFVLPLERRFQARRHALAEDFVRRRVTSEMTVVDVGCGTGRLTSTLAETGAKVIAVDFAHAALERTMRAIRPERLPNVTPVLLDIMRAAPPPSDVVIAVGVMPCAVDPRPALDNLCAATQAVAFSISDARNPFGLIRRAFPALNPRRICFQSPRLIRNLLMERGFRIDRETRFATQVWFEATRR